MDYEFTMDVELDVLNAEELLYIGIDASHYNEYVAGNYKDSMATSATWLPDTPCGRWS